MPVSQSVNQVSHGVCMTRDLVSVHWLIASSAHSPNDFSCTTGNYDPCCALFSRQELKSLCSTAHRLTEVRASSDAACARYSVKSFGNEVMTTAFIIEIISYVSTRL